MLTKEIDTITEDVEKLFRFNTADLFFLKVDTGKKYLEERVPDAEIRGALEHHPKFWHWWNELWAERDRRLLSLCVEVAGVIWFRAPVASLHPTKAQCSVVTPIPKSDQWDFYKKYHRPQNIKFYPNLVLINECMGKNELVTL